MYSDPYKKLDNPVWHAFQTMHGNLSVGTDTTKRYLPNILQIIGFDNPKLGNLTEIESWVDVDEKFFVVGDLSPLPENWKYLKTLECIQMVCPELRDLKFKSSEAIIQLSNPEIEEILELINLVQPGYFHKKTPELGSYYGIKKDGKLVAMAGERLRMSGFTEISAVVTHPDYTGKGFAQQLVAHVARKNLEIKCIPFLHFVSSNIRAASVYELLGFKTRKTIPFHQIQLIHSSLTLPAT